MVWGGGVVVAYRNTDPGQLLFLLEYRVPLVQFVTFVEDSS